MLRFTSLLFAAALLAQPAQGAVTYTWQQVQASSSMPANLNLEIEFSNKSINQGSLTLDIRNECQFGSCEFSQNDLLSLRYWYGSPDGTGKLLNLIDYGYRTEQSGIFDHIRLDVTFQPDGLLNGWISANNGESDFYMRSADGLFTVMRAHSDQESGCGLQYPNCSGSTGMLVAVPEPSSAALAGLGLLAGWFARRRKGQA